MTSSTQATLSMRNLFPKRYEHVQIDDYVYLDDDGTIMKSAFFGLVKTEQSNQALYKVIDRHREHGSSFIRFTVRHTRNRSIRNITVPARTRTHKRR